MGLAHRHTCVALAAVALAAACGGSADPTPVPDAAPPPIAACGPIDSVRRVVVDQRTVTAVVPLDDGVFWCEPNRDQGGIVRMSAAPESLAVAPGCQQLAVDQEFVYWTEAIGRVKRVSRTGGPSTTIAESSIAVQWGPLALDDRYVYWIGTAENGGLWRAPKTAPSVGQAELVVSPLPGPYDLAVDADSVFLTTDTGVYRWSKGTGALVQIAGGIGTPLSGVVHWRSLAQDRTHLLVATRDRILRVSKNGTQPPDFIPFPAECTGADALVQRDGCAYLSCGGAIYRTPATGGAWSRLVSTKLDYKVLFWFGVSARALVWPEWTGFAGPRSVYAMSL